MRVRYLRLRELWLLIWPIASLSIGLAMLTLVNAEQVTLLGMAYAWGFGLMLLALSIALSVLRPDADQLLLPLVGMLISISLVIVARLQPQLLSRQFIWVVLGSVTLIGIQVWPDDLRWLNRYKYSWALLGVVLALAATVIGADPGGSGARLWLSLGSFQFQPSELMKVVLVIFLAGYLDENRELIISASYGPRWLHLPPLPFLVPMLTIWGVAILLLFVQQDLGAALLLFGIFLTLLYVATAQSSYVALGLGLFSAAAYLAYWVTPRVQNRVSTWLNPYADPLGRSYQLIQGLTGMAFGGILGRGIGNGYPGLVPAAHTDFPLAAIGEEMGLLGTLAVVSLLALLTYRAWRISLQARTTFNALLGAGLSTILGLQAFIIMGGNLKLIPLTGITLPFISYGGSSMIVNFILLGLLLRISEDQA